MNENINFIFVTAIIVIYRHVFAFNIALKINKYADFYSYLKIALKSIKNQ